MATREGGVKLDDLLSHAEIAELVSVRHGADVWGYGNAKLLRSVQKKAPSLIEICKAMEKPPGHMCQPYFGCIATPAGQVAIDAYIALLAARGRA